MAVKSLNVINAFFIFLSVKQFLERSVDFRSLTVYNILSSTVLLEFVKNVVRQFPVTADSGFIY